MNIVLNHMSTLVNNPGAPKPELCEYNDIWYLIETICLNKTGKDHIWKIKE